MAAPRRPPAPNRTGPAVRRETDADFADVLAWAESIRPDGRGPAIPPKPEPGHARSRPRIGAWADGLRHWPERAKRGHAFGRGGAAVSEAIRRGIVRARRIADRRSAPIGHANGLAPRIGLTVGLLALAAIPIALVVVFAGGEPAAIDDGGGRSARPAENSAGSTTPPAPREPLAPPVRQIPLPRPISAAPEAGGKGDAARLPAAGSADGSYVLQPPFNILDGRTFAPEHAQPTRLDGIAGPDTHAVCFGRDGKLWACGLQARALLSRLTTSAAVSCVRTPGAARENGAVLATCRTGDRDLARAMVAGGFARPNEPAPPELARAEAEARTGGLGLWGGGWRIR